MPPVKKRVSNSDCQCKEFRKNREMRQWPIPNDRRMRQQHAQHARQQSNRILNSAGPAEGSYGYARAATHLCSKASSSARSARRTFHERQEILSIRPMGEALKHRTRRGKDFHFLATEDIADKKSMENLSQDCRSSHVSLHRSDGLRAGCGGDI